MTDIIYNLRHPAWSWTHAGGSQLDKDETLIDMSDAADEIERLRSAIAWMENLDPPLVEAALARFELVLPADHSTVPSAQGKSE